MRVEAYNQVAQLYNREKTQKVQNTKQMSTGRDEVQISSMGRDYQIAKQAVADASDIREDRVAQLKDESVASLMEELLDVLGKEEKQYQELITLATEKTDAVVQGNIEHLTDVTTREQDAASVLLNLSNKRNRVLTDMATVLGQSPEEMTITKMIGYLNKQPKEQEALTRQRDRLLEAGAKMQQLRLPTMIRMPIIQAIS